MTLGNMEGVIMKALSLHGDYAMMILAGEKTVEYRSWKTDYRGKLLICSSAMKIRGTMPGYATCVIDLVDIKKAGPRDYEWQLGKIYDIEPFPVKGKLHLYDVPDDKIVYHPEVDDDHHPTQEQWDEYQKKYIDPYIY
ncbi:hypothetical protein FD08_GL000533 [Lentilactobacillus parakefiri DSM 10551]|nr:hypothetical protein FD08_GL000533 [Lentilactobacillus parakefiri DSM 10551]